MGKRKEYRHGIKVENNKKPKIKKADLLRRIEILECKIFALEDAKALLEQQNNQTK